MPIYTKLDGVAFKDEFKVGYHIGAFLEIGLPGKLGLQPEVYYSQVNPSLANNASAVYGFNNITKIKLSYINIPVLLNIHLAPFISAQVGPQFGIMTDKNKGFLQNGKDAFKKRRHWACSRPATQYKEDQNLRTLCSGIAGLNDVNNSNSGKWHNQSIHLGVGLRLF